MAAPIPLRRRSAVVVDHERVTLLIDACTHSCQGSSIRQQKLPSLLPPSPGCFRPQDPVASDTEEGQPLLRL